MNTLVVYRNRGSYFLRQTIRDHLNCFLKYAPGNVYYLNEPFGIPGYIQKISFDLIVFHTTFLASRWHPNAFRQGMARLDPLKNLNSLKIAFPQDEFLHSKLLCQFFEEFNIRHIFTCANRTDAEKIYSPLLPEKVTFHHVLTGYLEPSTIKWIQKHLTPNSSRPIHIGYRAYKAPFWLGERGILKQTVASFVNDNLKGQQFITDISTERSEIFLGKQWYKFLLKCQYVLGVEGGSSILDAEGSIQSSVESYLRIHPNATFEETKENCFKGKERTLDLFCLSPRHLEACATHTAQILIEGNYNNVLIPDRHYVPLKPDFSNWLDVLKKIREKTCRTNITNNAYNDIVLSKKYDYPTFIQQVYKDLFPNLNMKTMSASKPYRHRHFLRNILIHTTVFSISLVKFLIFRTLPNQWTAKFKGTKLK